jgi:hypothetical protein
MRFVDDSLIIFGQQDTSFLRSLLNQCAIVGAAHVFADSQHIISFVA